MNAIGMSNGGDYVLPSSVCTSRFDHITRFITGLEVGSVKVREVPARAFTDRTWRRRSPRAHLPEPSELLAAP
ncbi:TPA: hypothetical protein QDA94_005371 [Burkholderia vietnamiensis]|nr:hypothetical protein [Burkholderia vietnamiensis]HDR9051089.1 hypothetical protein [Burkholderia vietnamiensis]HDR9232701.1 hypothetical protein [Burkholderia vietnamiensis]